MKRSMFEGNKRFYAEVGLRIARARRGRLTQVALAKKTGLTRTSIVNIEKGRQQILLHTIVAIAQALHVDVAELIPISDSVELLLMDKPQKGQEWILSSRDSIHQEGDKDGRKKEAD